LGSRLGSSGSYLMLAGNGEYAFSSAISVVAEARLGLSGTIPIQVSAGAKYRLTGLALPVSPFLEGDLVGGRLFDVLGANLNILGARIVAGADYFLTSNTSIGMAASYQLAQTRGERPAWFGMADLVVRAGLAF
jgi:hypothetical protein